MATYDFNANFYTLSTVLRSFAYRLTQDREDAMDLYQETAFRAWKNKDKFKAGTNFRAWLMTIMKNIFINNYRKKVKRNRFIDNTDDQYYINSAVKVENRVESNMMMDELSSLVNSLEDNLKIPFVMHYLGHKYQEISESLKIPLGTIKSRIHLARKELKKSIQERYGDIRA